MQSPGTGQFEKKQRRREQFLAHEQPPEVEQINAQSAVTRAIARDICKFRVERATPKANPCKALRTKAAYHARTVTQALYPKQYPKHSVQKTDPSKALGAAEALYNPSRATEALSPKHYAEHSVQKTDPWKALGAEASFPVRRLVLTRDPGLRHEIQPLEIPRPGGLIGYSYPKIVYVGSNCTSLPVKLNPSPYRRLIWR